MREGGVSFQKEGESIKKQYEKKAKVLYDKIYR